MNDPIMIRIQTELVIIAITDGRKIELSDPTDDLPVNTAHLKRQRLQNPRLTNWV